MEMLSDQERNRLINECAKAINKVVRLANDKFGNIRDISENLKGRTTEEKFNYLKSLREIFPNVKEIREPYQMLFNECNAVIKLRDAIYRKLHGQETLLDEKMGELNVGKKELEKRLHEVRPIADQMSARFTWMQDIALPAMKFLSELEDLYNIEAEIIREIENVDRKQEKTKKEYKIEFNVKMKNDIQKFCTAEEAEWDGKEKPNFKSLLFLIGLIEHWKAEFYFDSPDNVIHPWINHNFLVNGLVPNCKTYNINTQYQNKKDEIDKKIKNILSEIKKI